MLLQPTIETLHRLKLSGMVQALTDQENDPRTRELSFEERLGLLVDREAAEQDSRRLNRRLRQARLRQPATFEDIDLRTPRGLSRAMIHDLGSCRWVRDHRNLLIIGPTGVGKSYIACGLVHKACREGHSVRYYRTSRLLQELALARGEGRYIRQLKTLAQTEVIVLDDWGLEPLRPEGRHDLLELLDDRHERKSTVITSQVPPEKWHELIGEATIADAILDRVVHNAHLVQMKGESMRRRKAKSETQADS